ncbi:spore germination protein [Clostridium tyrobutyricum]|uniref:spore germination protein n=1 Tax=Clostridium tyrobutyricum TaxID=1519 RepID=UPI001C38DF19|nr:spore germination protein [Clostridium tyrobutyricum]MBV4419192.1 spore germination protein [Clostridium tyrobutyricum]
MKKNQNIFKKAMSLFTYKEKKKVKQFSIPEVDEKDEDTAENNCEGPDSSADTNRFKNFKYYKIDTSKKIPSGLEKNIDMIQKLFHFPQNKDINIKRIRIADKYNGIIVYLRGMTDLKIIDQYMIKPLLEYKINDKKNENNDKEVTQKQEIDFIQDQIIEISRTQKYEHIKDITNEILDGNTAMYIDGSDYYLLCYTKGFKKRALGKPQIEGSIKGSQEGFNEDLDTNVSLIRKIIKNKDLVTEKLRIGNSNNNDCAVMYMDGIVNPAIVDEVKRRINSIDTDFINGSGMLEQYIQDDSWSVIPTLLSTERPDRTANYIMDGKVAIITFGTPYAIIVPITFFLLFHTAEDNSLKWQHTLILRITRMFGLLVAIMLPGIYISLANYHQEMIPTSLLIAIATARENVPFPTIVEIIFMEIAFDLIREAGIRIPGIIGNTIGIVGGLIIGQAAVQASIISPVLIIIIGFTSLGNYSIPDFNLGYGTRIFRLLFIMLGALLGFLGISIGIILMIMILSNLKSFGVPFFSIISPKIRTSNDAALNKPVWKQELRPDPINPINLRKQPKISKKWENEDADYNKDSDESK